MRPRRKKDVEEEPPIDDSLENDDSGEEYSETDASGSEEEVTLNILERQPRITAGMMHNSC